MRSLHGGTGLFPRSTSRHLTHQGRAGGITCRVSSLGCVSLSLPSCRNFPHYVDKIHLRNWGHPVTKSLPNKCPSYQDVFEIFSRTLFRVWKLKTKVLQASSNCHIVVLPAKTQLQNLPPAADNKYGIENKTEKIACKAATITTASGKKIKVAKEPSLGGSRAEKSVKKS